jgi:hypothetical protein
LALGKTKWSILFFPFVLGISSLSFTTGIVYLTSMLLTKHNSSGAQSFGRELGMFRTIKERALSTISGKFFWSKRKGKFVHRTL